MALYHLTVNQIKRSAGQSAIAATAYRAGERLYSDYYGEYSDYTRKGGVPRPGSLVEYSGTGGKTPKGAACIQL